MILNLNAQIIWVFVNLLVLFLLMKKFLFGSGHQNAGRAGAGRV